MYQTFISAPGTVMSQLAQARPHNVLHFLVRLYVGGLKYHCKYVHVNGTLQLVWHINFMEMSAIGTNECSVTSLMITIMS